MPAVTPEIFDRICERLAEGESLRAICRDDGMPSMSTIFRFLRDEANETARQQYAQAREDQADVDADKISEQADLVAAGKADPQAARVAIDAWKWAAGKRKPKVYGDRVAIGGAEDMPAIKTETTVSDDVRAALDAIAGKIAGGAGKG